MHQKRYIKEYISTMLILAAIAIIAITIGLIKFLIAISPFAIIGKIATNATEPKFRRNKRRESAGHVSLIGYADNYRYASKGAKLRNKRLHRN